jgi:parallel beta-helix repeat protein
LVFSFIAASVIIATPNVQASPATLNVPVPYLTIQAAVDAASPGDTISVAAGTYREQVTIRSDDHHLTLIGAPGAIIADALAGSLLYGIDFKGGAHDITISGFEITGFDEFWDAGIAGWMNWWDSDFAAIYNIKIQDCNIHDNYDGIVIGLSWDPPFWHSNIAILDNQICKNHYRGIRLDYTDPVTISGNDISDNGGDWDGDGIFNEVPGDDQNGNGVPDGDGITLVVVENTIVCDNTIDGNREVGLSINGEWLASKGGIWYSPQNIVVRDNDVTNNPNLGILIKYGDVDITCNNILNNGQGVYIMQYDPSRSHIDVSCNNIVGNTVWGVNNLDHDAVDATQNWWGDATGPHHATSWLYLGNPYGPHLGSGDSVSDYVLYDPWLKWSACGPAPVGGEWVPMDKLNLLTPWASLASMIVVATAFAFSKRLKRQLD